MLFGYEELKEYVKEDFERFYEMGFNEKQILSAVLNEYEHGEDFCLVEDICIHVLLGLKYSEKRRNNSKIIEEINQLIHKETENEIKIELGDEYPKFITDLNRVRRNQ